MSMRHKKALLKRENNVQIHPVTTRSLVSSLLAMIRNSGISQVSKLLLIQIIQQFYHILCKDINNISFL